MGSDTAFSYFKELEILKDLNEAESAAFLDLLVLAILADSKITDEELAQMDEELMRLPFVWDADVRERVTAHSADTRTFLEKHIEDHETITTFIKSFATKITEDDHREIALRMFIAITMSDGISELERNRCITLAETFGQSRESVDQLIEKLG